MRSLETRRWLRPCAALALALSISAAAGRPAQAEAAPRQASPEPARPFSLAFQGVSYAAAFQHDGGTDWFLEMTRPGETVDTWRTLLVLHWLPAETATPEVAANRLAAVAHRASPAAHALVSENARGHEAFVSLLAFPRTRGPREGVVYKYGRTVGGNGLVAVQYSVRFDEGATPATVKRVMARAEEAIKRFDLGQVEIDHGRWGPPPGRTAAAEAPPPVGALR